MPLLKEARGRQIFIQLGTQLGKECYVVFSFAVTYSMLGCRQLTLNDNHSLWQLTLDCPGFQGTIPAFPSVPKISLAYLTSLAWMSASRTETEKTDAKAFFFLSLFDSPQFSSCQFDVCFFTITLHQIIHSIRKFWVNLRLQSWWTKCVSEYLIMIKMTIVYIAEYHRHMGSLSALYNKLLPGQTSTLKS